jgi:GT2 family glycosyltransferase
MKVAVLMSSYNRKDKTRLCIETLAARNEMPDFAFIVVDDNSNDGTKKMLELMKDDYDIHVITGTGGLFYSGAMRLCMEYVIGHPDGYDYVLLVNDDVKFFDGCITRMISDSIRSEAVIVGATCSAEGVLSYGAVKYTKGIRYKTLAIEEEDLTCDTFNANCVLIPYVWFVKTEIIDRHFRHTLGDFDYGFSIRRAGFKIQSTCYYVGECNKNENQNIWGNKKLSRIQRIKLKESVKGAPFRQWFYYLKKNFGLRKALLHSVTPFIRIILKQ